MFMFICVEDFFSKDYLVRESNLVYKNIYVSQIATLLLFSESRETKAFMFINLKYLPPVIGL